MRLAGGKEPSMPSCWRVASILAGTVLVLAPASRSAAQATRVTSRGPTEGSALPPTGAALADEVTAPEINPAGLAQVRGLGLIYIHERNLGIDSIDDSLFLGDTFFDVLGVGLSLQWIREQGRPSFRKTTWAFSLGGRTLSLGLNYNLFSADESEDIDHLSTWDAGLLVRPASFLSVGFAAKDFNGAHLSGTELPRRYDLGLGVRPFSDRITLGADLLVDDRGGFSESRLAFTAWVEPFSGFLVLAGLDTGLNSSRVAGQISIALNGPFFGATLASGADSDFDRSNHLIQLRASAERYRSLELPTAHWEVLDLDAHLHRRGAPLVSLFAPSSRDPYLELLSTLSRMREDRHLAGVVVKVTPLDGLGQARIEELRSALSELRQHGKHLVAYFMEGGDSEYLVASAAERIYTVPQATFLVNGLSASAIFFATALNKLGVTVDVARVGAYKNAPDELTRSDMSPEQREVLDSYLDGAFARFLSAVEQARSLNEESLRATVDRGILSAQSAKEAGLVDDLLYPDELPSKLEAIQHGAVSLSDHYPAEPDWPRRWGERPKIAIVNIEGVIAEGKSRTDPFGMTRVAGAETIVKQLQSLLEDRRVAAVVIRIESGGGSGSASDLIWRAVRNVREHKPVIVSMGDYAASGGYYIAMAGDEVLAEPSTLTGSIGVFALKPGFGPLLAKLGIHPQVLKRGDKADLFSLARSWTSGEQEAMQRYIDEFYNLFITRVAESRNLEKSKVDSIAQGRVWSGEAAQKIGLVDELGSLSDAIARAQRRAGLEGKEVEVELLKGEGGVLELPFASTGEERQGLGRLLGEVAAPFGLALIDLPDVPLAILPWRVTVK
jgi:protease-4